jgi:glutathione S-transferase
MIIVHHLSDSRSQRILWLLEELGLPYEVKRYERDRKTMLAPLALRKVHPLGKAPVVEDEGIALIETGAIVEHLVRKGHGAGGPDLGPPDDLPGLLLWRQFLHYAEGSLMPPLLALLVVHRLGPLGWPARKPLLAMFAQHLRWLDAGLATHDWFAGNRFTAADVMMSFPLEAARQRAGLDGRYPKLLAWLERIHERPAYKAALERGGAYAYG